MSSSTTDTPIFANGQEIVGVVLRPLRPLRRLELITRVEEHSTYYRGLVLAVKAVHAPAVTPTEGPIVRLFRDFVSAERGYFARTGIEPAHHLIVLRREIVADHPWLPGRVLEALEASRRQAARTRRVLGDVTPWLLAALEETEALMGATAGAYGVEPNRAMIATFCAEQFAQGLVSAPIDSESAFATPARQR